MTATRYVILAEGFSGDPHYGKTMWGVLRYRRDDVVAILDSTRAPGDAELGVPIVQTVDEALRLRAEHRARRRRDTGRPLPARVDRAAEAVRRGRPRHRERPARLPERRRRPARERRGARRELRDLRRPPADVSTATGENLSVPGTIVLTVGSDCAIGKMTVSLELDLEARRRGRTSVFVPTGQTGIAIAGWGISVDAVVADFIAGAAERLVVEGSQRGGGLDDQVLWVEGQGSLIHPVYSGVTLGLYHGSVPHTLVLCHQAGHTEIEGAGGGPHPIPPLRELVELHERLALPARPARVAAVALNTRELDEDGRPVGDRRRRGRDRPPGGRSGPLRRGQARGRGARA